MKRGLGFVTLFVALLAGARLTNGPGAGSGNNSSTSVAAAPRQQSSPAASCEAFANPAAATPPSGAAPSAVADKGEITLLVERFLYGGQRALSLAALPDDVRIMIVTVPDPVHTRLSLQFDRTLEAIQQAAQDENYTYDSSWLPWKSHGPEFSSLADQKAEASETAAREVCPGIILFRRNMRTVPANPAGTAQTNSCRAAQDSSADRSDVPYVCGMVVLVVGEDPTAGLNTTQWNNALAWTKQYASKSRTDTALRVLGPIFSGSMPSFVRALRDVDRSDTSFTSILLYSGRIRGCASWRWLKVMLSPLTQPVMKLPVRTADFEEHDAVQIDRFYRYLEDRGHSISEVAILSEDETTYGGLPDARSGADQENSQPPPCSVHMPEYPPNNRPVHVYYPRDISAIRSA